MKKITLLFLLMIFLMTAGVAAGNMELTTRSLGMGGAFTAIADDITTVVYNPAGITQVGPLGANVDLGVRVSELMEMMELRDVQNMFKDFDPENELESVQELYDNLPTDFELDSRLLLAGNTGSLGISLKNNNQILTEKDANKIQMDNTLQGILTYGNEIISPVLNLGTIAYGINFKLLKSSYKDYIFDESEDQILNTEAEGKGFGMDSGVLVKVTDLITFGLQIQDIYTPDYKLRGQEHTYDIIEKEWESGTEQELETISFKPQIRAGAAVKVPLLKINVAADIDNVNGLIDDSLTPVYHLGLEKNLFFNALSLRGGYIKKGTEKQMYTAGLGLNLLAAEVNTAVAADSSLKEDYTLLVSGQLQF